MNHVVNSLIEIIKYQENIVADQLKIISYQKHEYDSIMNINESLIALIKEQEHALSIQDKKIIKLSSKLKRRKR